METERPQSDWIDDIDHFDDLADSYFFKTWIKTIGEQHQRFEDTLPSPLIDEDEKDSEGASAKPGTG